MRCFLITWLLIALCQAAFAAEADGQVRIPIGRETSFFDGPLDKVGEVDLETALNERLRSRITPERNVNVLLIQALGPVPDPVVETVLSARFFKWLETPALPLKGDYFIPITRYEPREEPLSEVERQQLYDQWGRSGEAPWKESELPLFAAWLRVNESPLEKIMAASRRDQYYNPLVTPRGQGPDEKGLASVLLPNVQAIRNVCTALRGRAMLRLGQGAPDEAWDDLLAAHRLARFTSQGGLLIEHLVGYATERHLCTTDLVFVERCRLSSRQLRRRLKDLQQLPPFGLLGDKIELGERVGVLDIVRQIRQGRDEYLSQLIPKSKPLTAAQKRELASFDWAEIQRGINRWHDRAAAVSRIRDRAARQQAWAEWRKEFMAIKGPASGYESLQNFLFEKVQGKSSSGAFRDRVLHHFSALPVSVEMAQSLQDRVEQYTTNLPIGIATVIYHREHKKYPARLEDLVPDYLPAVPLDLFSGKPLAYQPATEGFTFYSVGKNGKDDGGKELGEGAAADDLRFRVNKLLPALAR